MENRRAAYLLIAPSAAIFLLLFAAPFLYFFAVSFFTKKLYKIQPTFTLANYEKVASGYLDVGLFTIVMALAIALATTVLGFVYAYLIRFKAGRYGPLLLFVALVTLFGGYLMKIYAWKVILGNEGILNSALLTAGLIDRPFTALLYSPEAVAVTLVNFLLPLAVLPIYGALRGVRDIELEAARDLGARPPAILAGIIVPRCRSGLIAAFVFCFLIAAGDYVTPLLVGGKMTMIGNLIAPKFGQFFDWPLGAAMSFAVLLVALVVLGASSLLMSLWRPR